MKRGPPESPWHALSPGSPAQMFVLNKNFTVHGELLNGQFLLKDWPWAWRRDVAVVGFAVFVACYSEVHLLEAGAQRPPRAGSPPPDDRGCVPREGVGGGGWEADWGNGLGEGEGRAQGQDGDVISYIDRVVARMDGDRGDCPDMDIIIFDVVLSNDHTNELLSFSW